MRKDNPLIDEVLHNKYTTVIHWRNELAFYQDELRFLQTLSSKYFIWVSNKERIFRLQQMIYKLHQLDNENERLLQDTAKHLVHLKNQIEDPNGQFEICKMEHRHLESSYLQFIEDVRLLKHEIFPLAEEAIQNQKLGQMLQVL